MYIKQLAVMLLALAVAACGGGNQTVTTVTATPDRCIQSGCDGKEVTSGENPCFRGLSDVFAVKESRAPKGYARGTLKIMKVMPQRCEGIYYGLFAPDNGNEPGELPNEDPFTVTLIIGSNIYPSQKSEPGNPTVNAFTVGGYVRLEDKDVAIKVCLDSPEQQAAFCITTTSV